MDKAYRVVETTGHEDGSGQCYSTTNTIYWFKFEKNARAMVKRSYGDTYASMTTETVNIHADGTFSTDENPGLRLRFEDDS